MPTVKLLPQNIEVQLPSGSSLTELEFELHGQESIPFGCRAGACGACVIEVLEGLDQLGKRSTGESAFLDTLGYAGDAFRLACQCRVNGAVAIRVAAPHT
ncbi:MULTISPECIES: 2Fe-2S iron-sulfur cluster-binding protein [unclassified Burkholderia]|uniref:2Fe-2S iron-sulfur cluster-binding protein n=1 Tax=unclassified Burkholderia TaxID=2613784 RepID=UPI000752B524|nr:MULTISPECIES: 2Fe-2S iron-sulfur cluster-binding protein [unclassified Burkholderia]KVN06765.1 ferredoxin [Burkholderia sp. MSMB1552]KWZ50013.1 ferredoxin [Burkholderia sp. MSMB1588]